MSEINTNTQNSEAGKPQHLKILLTEEIGKITSKKVFNEQVVELLTPIIRENSGKKDLATIIVLEGLMKQERGKEDKDTLAGKVAIQIRDEANKVYGIPLDDNKIKYGNIIEAGLIGKIDAILTPQTRHRILKAIELEKTEKSVEPPKPEVLPMKEIIKGIPEKTLHIIQGWYKPDTNPTSPPPTKLAQKQETQRQ